MPLPAPSAPPRTAGSPAILGSSRLALPVAVALAVAGRLLLPVEGDADSIVSASASAEASTPNLPPRATRRPQPRPSTEPAALPPAPGGLWPLAPEPALFVPMPLVSGQQFTGVAGADPAAGTDPAL